jgi:hypothetical protein
MTCRENWLQMNLPTVGFNALPTLHERNKRAQNTLTPAFFDCDPMKGPSISMVSNKKLRVAPRFHQARGVNSMLDSVREHARFAPVFVPRSDHRHVCGTKMEMVAARPLNVFVAKHTKAGSEPPGGRTGLSAAG